VRVYKQIRQTMILISSLTHHLMISGW